MTASQDGSILDRLTEATMGDAMAADGETRKPLPQAWQRSFNDADRQAITGQNMDKMIEQLNFTSDRLQGAMHRIGYLESQVETYEGQLSFMPDFRAKAARCIILEKENQELKAVIEHRNRQILKREQLLDERSEQVSILEKLCAAYRKHLTMVEHDLSVLENSGWVRFCSWFTGTPIK